MTDPRHTSSTPHERPVWSHRPVCAADLPPAWGSPSVWLLALLAAALGALFAAVVIELSVPAPPTPIDVSVEVTPTTVTTATDAPDRRRAAAD